MFGLKPSICLWAICLAVAVMVLTVGDSHAHGGAHKPLDKVSIALETGDETIDTSGHCHGGASCGVAAIICAAGISVSYVANGAGLLFTDKDLNNLIAHSFDPPPPRILS